jgi:hypothetical protein
MFLERAKLIADLCLDRRPDVICFQEVLPEFLAHLQTQPWLDDYACSDERLDGGSLNGYGNVMLVRKALRPTAFHLIPLPSRMGRKLLCTEISLCRNQVSLESEMNATEELKNCNGEMGAGNVGSIPAKVTIGTVHLESLNHAALRREQLAMVARHCSQAMDAVICGDMNFCSYRNFHMPPAWSTQQAILENSMLAEVITCQVCVDVCLRFMHRPKLSVSVRISTLHLQVAAEYDDLWPLLTGFSGPAEGVAEGVAKGSGMSTDEVEIVEGLPPKAGDEAGYTFDTETNPNLAGHPRERMRYDRVLSKRGGAVVPRSIQVVGDRPVQMQVQTGTQADAVAICPSDHYGLLATFSTSTE